MNEYDELMPFVQHGILTGLQEKKKKRLMALAWLAEHIPPEKEYSEAEFGALLNGLHSFGDAAALRRALCDTGLVGRRPDGSAYRLDPGRPSLRELLERHCGAVPEPAAGDSLPVRFAPPEINDEDLAHAADFRDRIHAEALEIVRRVRPELSEVADPYPVEAYFQRHWDYPGAWYVITAIPESAKSREALLDTIVRNTLAKAAWRIPPQGTDMKKGTTRMKRILFIGNSFTYFNEMPAMVQGMADAAGLQADVRMLAYGGYELRRYTDPADPHGNEALPLIASEPWDAVVLQEQSIAPAIRRDLFREGVDGLVPAIRGRGAMPVFYATWPYQEGSPKLSGTGLEYREMLRLLSEGYQAEAGRLGCPLVPVGEAFVRFQDAHPGFCLYKSDFYHPNAAGSFLAACLFFRFFFGCEAPETYLPEGLTPADAETVRRSAAAPEG